MIRHLRADARLWWGALVTSWFWLVGIVVLSLLPPLIKTRIGGDEATVTAYLALFSVAVGVGSGAGGGDRARAHRAQDDARAARVLLGLFALDIGIASVGGRRGGDAGARRRCFHRALGIRAAVDLAGLAIAGGLFIVPVFAAVQAWAGADYRARTIAAVNVLNAAFMTGGDGAGGDVAEVRRHRAGACSWALGAATLLVALAIWQTMPKH